VIATMYRAAPAPQLLGHWPLRRSLRVEGAWLALALSLAWVLAFVTGAACAAVAALVGVGDAALVLMVVALLGGMGYSAAAYLLWKRLMRRPRPDGASVRLYESVLEVADVRMPIDRHLAIEVRWFIGYTGTGKHRGLLSAAHLRVCSPALDFILFTAGDLGALPARSAALGAERTEDLFRGLEVPRWQVWPEQWLELTEALVRRRREIETDATS